MNVNYGCLFAAVEELTAYYFFNNGSKIGHIFPTMTA